jgi:SAM-dependent methyltransferase
MFNLIEIHWAQKRDLASGTLWKSWFKDNKLPRWFWQRTWEYPWVLSKVDSKETLLDVGGTYPFVLFKHFPNAISVDSRDLNSVGHYLHDGLWPEGSLIISDARAIPLPDKSFDCVMSISALEEMPNPDQVLAEMMRIAKKRVVLTCDVGGYGIPVADFEKLFSLWNVTYTKSLKMLTSLSPILVRYRQRPVWKNRKIRVVGLVFERAEVYLGQS